MKYFTNTNNLEEMLAQYRDMKQELTPAMDALKNLENTIKAHVKETGETAEVEGASISIRNGYTRVSWDSTALAGFAVVHPEINEFKTVREIGPSVTIKVN